MIWRFLSNKENNRDVYANPYTSDSLNTISGNEPVLQILISAVLPKHTLFKLLYFILAKLKNPTLLIGLLKTTLKRFLYGKLF